MQQPSPQDLAEGIVQFVPELHNDLLRYIEYEGQVYAINPVYIDWDSDIEEWNPNSMQRWPFGVQPTEEEKLIEEVLGCLELLDHHLDDEIEEMDRLEDLENEAEDDEA